MRSEPVDRLQLDGNLQAHDLGVALGGVVPGPVRSTEEDAAAFPRLADFAFDRGAVYVGRFQGVSPWERHPGADELLHVLDGEVLVILLRESGPLQITMRAGSVLVVPRGIWHQQSAQRQVTLLAVTPDHSEVSFANDPRRPPGGEEELAEGGP